MNSEIILRAYRDDDEPAILRLNEESVAVLSPMDGARFADLRAMAAWLEVAERDGRVIGFLLGFEDGSDYDSANYRWFAERFKRFFYVDRVVVDAESRGAGLGRWFYEAAEEWAVDRGLLWMLAEIDVEPRNPESIEFHRRRGFSEIAQRPGLSAKRVSMQARALGSHRTPHRATLRG